MREIVYELVKEDYQDWVHWNVKKNYSEKARKKTVFVFVALTAAFVLSGIFFNKSLTAIMPTLLIGIGGGMYILKSTSFEGQVKMVWKRSGLDKLEKSGDYPIIHLNMLDRGMKMVVEKQDMVKAWGYKDIVGFEETDRLFLIEAADKTWQFVAKSGFESREEMDEFLAFLTEKMEAAKAEPEKYSEEAMAQEQNPEASLIEADGLLEDGEEKSSSAADEDGSPAEIDFSDDNVKIEHVDTSSMGKIGKMAHIMAAMAAASDEEEAEEETVEVKAEETAEVKAEETAEAKAEEV